MSLTTHLSLNESEPLSGTRVEFDHGDEFLPVYVSLGARPYGSAPLTMHLSLAHAERLLECLLAAMPDESRARVLGRVEATG